MARTKVWSEQSQAWVYADRVVAKDGTSVTIESIEESTVAGGSTRITFSDGNTILVKNGASAYQYAVQAGFTGTEQEFAERLNTKSKITKSDLESSVQSSLNKADSALQPNDLADWAKAAAKPTYTASEVGALPDSTKIPSKLGDLDNDKQYITAAEVPDEIYVGDGTMPNTATIQFIMDASDEEALLKDELQEYINTEIEAAKTKLELDIPTKTSQLTNDSGFITAKDIPEAQVPDLSGYAKTKDIPTKTSQLTNDSGFITQHQSLAGYAKTSDIPTKVSQLTNDSGFITAKDIPQAQVPDLSGYALKSSAETWTFTLSDGSKVTKKVVLA